MKNKQNSDMEKVYSRSEFIKKLRRFADALESGKNFSIQILSQKIRVPKDAVINIEHESDEEAEEIEFQVKWNKEK